MQLGNDQDKNFSYFQLIIKMLIPTYTYYLTLIHFLWSFDSIHLSSHMILFLAYLIRINLPIIYINDRLNIPCQQIIVRI